MPFLKSLQKWLSPTRLQDKEVRDLVELLAGTLRSTFHAHGIVCVAVKNPNAHRLRAAVKAMPILCHGHDIERAICGRLERLVGIECPQYDPGPLDPPIKCARTGSCRTE